MKSQKEIRKACEKLWAENKYLVLSKSHRIYLHLRAYLQSDSPSVEEIEKEIEKAIGLPENPGQVQNALEHLWGYFKTSATLEEKEVFFELLGKYQENTISLREPLAYLQDLLKKYPNPYLERSTIFSYYLREGELDMGEKNVS